MECRDLNFKQSMNALKNKCMWKVSVRTISSACFNLPNNMSCWYYQYCNTTVKFVIYTPPKMIPVPEGATYCEWENYVVGYFD